MVFSFSTVPSRETILRFTSAVPELSPVITRVAPFIVRINASPSAEKEANMAVCSVRVDTQASI